MDIICLGLYNTTDKVRRKDARDRPGLLVLILFQTEGAWNYSLWSAVRAGKAEPGPEKSTPQKEPFL